MRVYRGRADTADGDRAVSHEIVDRVAETGASAVRVWCPPRHVAFGRRDARADGYERARKIAAERGFPPVERSVGGRAVAYTGSTAAFARVVPVDDPRSGLRDRYDAATAAVRRALATVGVDVREGEPDGSFCPGSHSLQIRDAAGRDRKVAGLAQRVRTDVAIVAGVLLISDHEAIAAVLDPVYAALGVTFDPETVGSAALVSGDPNPDAVVGAVESALVGDREATVERVASLSE
jgi:lipoate-protein ligase A